MHWSSTLIRLSMMTSSNGNIFRVTGLLCGEFTGHQWIPRTKPVTRSFDVFFDLRLNKRLSKQSRGWWIETPSRPLWRNYNDYQTRICTSTLAAPVAWEMCGTLIYVKVSPSAVVLLHRQPRTGRRFSFWGRGNLHWVSITGVSLWKIRNWCLPNIFSIGGRTSIVNSMLLLEAASR